MTGSGVGDLPAEVEVKLADGTTETKSVEWNGDTNALDANAYKSASISGTVKDAVNAGRAPDRQRSDHRGHPRRHRLLYRHRGR